MEQQPAGLVLVVVMGLGGCISDRNSVGETATTGTEDAQSSGSAAAATLVSDTRGDSSSGSQTETEGEGETEGEAGIPDGFESNLVPETACLRFGGFAIAAGVPDGTAGVVLRLLDGETGVLASEPHDGFSVVRDLDDASVELRVLVGAAVVDDFCSDDIGKEVRLDAQWVATDGKVFLDFEPRAEGVTTSVVHAVIEAEVAVETGVESLDPIELDVEVGV